LKSTGEISMQFEIITCLNWLWKSSNIERIRLRPLASKTLLFYT